MTVSFAAACEDSGAAQRTKGSRAGVSPALLAGERNHVCNLVGHLARRSLPLIKLRQKSLSGLTECFEVLSCVVAVHVRQSNTWGVGNVRKVFGEIRNVVS